MNTRKRERYTCANNAAGFLRKTGRAGRIEVMMRVGSLFSGAGMGDLGFVMAGCEIVFQCEIDEYCQKILELRYPDAKKFRDIRTIKGKDLPQCDIITGGFPCQPFSVAGKQNGKDDNRYLWPEMLRVIWEVSPAWVVAENVPGIINIALDDVLADLASAGYETLPLVFPAHTFGAPHRRDRLWVIAHSASKDKQAGSGGKCGVEGGCENVSNPHSERQQKQRKQKPDGEKHSRSKCIGKNVSNATDTRTESMCEWKEPTNEDVCVSSSKRFQDGATEKIFSPEETEKFERSNWWASEPALGRVVNGCPHRVDRLKALGNGQVPACTKWIAEMIMEHERNISV